MERFQETYRITGEFIARNPTFVAERDGAMVGFYSLSVDGGNPALEYLYIAPEQFGQGWGRRLWEHMVDQCRNRSIASVEVICGPEPLPFYLKMGAVVTGLMPSRLDPARQICRLRFHPGGNPQPAVPLEVGHKD